MNLFSIFHKKDYTTQKVGGMQDYMMLIRVYLQAAVAAQTGLSNIAVLPDLRMFKTTYKVRTEHNKLGLGEKTACKKLLKSLFGHTDDFFKELDRSVARNCKKIQDVQTYLLQFQGFTQDTMMLITDLMKYKLRVPSIFKTYIYQSVEKNVNKVFTQNDFSNPSTLKAVASVRKYNQRLGFSQKWITDFIFEVVMLAKKEKAPADNEKA